MMFPVHESLFALQFWLERVGLNTGDTDCSSLENLGGFLDPGIHIWGLLRLKNWDER